MVKVHDNNEQIYCTSLQPKLSMTYTTIFMKLSVQSSFSHTPTSNYLLLFVCVWKVGHSWLYVWVTTLGMAGRTIWGAGQMSYPLYYLCCLPTLCINKFCHPNQGFVIVQDFFSRLKLFYLCFIDVWDYLVIFLPLNYFLHLVLCTDILFWQNAWVHHFLQLQNIPLCIYTITFLYIICHWTFGLFLYLSYCTKYFSEHRCAYIFLN